MRATVLFGPHDIQLVDVPAPELLEPGDAIVRLAATCVCGSDLWNYRGIRSISEPQRPGHELVGVVTEIGADVTAVKVGDFVVGPFNSNCGECAHCRAGFQSCCANVQMFKPGTQAEAVRIPLANGTLVPLAEHPDPALYPSLLACSDVMSTGWHAATMANVHPGTTVAIVGDGAVGLCGVIAAKELGAEKIIISSR
ncbi:MAG: alcohol dehydrogenase catalytic domain-containing protein, partial [Propionibacteriaceae bacterium]|nr:alcohol dehydrogenase catalytic domain-containing protein [Propionibacteriaceae bacterium]